MDINYEYDSSALIKCRITEYTVMFEMLYKYANYLFEIWLFLLIIFNWLLTAQISAGLTFTHWPSSGSEQLTLKPRWFTWSRTSDRTGDEICEIHHDQNQQNRSRRIRTDLSEEPEPIKQKHRIHSVRSAERVTSSAEKRRLTIWRWWWRLWRKTMQKISACRVS